ncbi:MAG TPA: hypothetical protein GXZ59_05340 [Clostridiaceae bacterium]|nr:hypothetical protein [Clostridiaceae bacterium]
MRNKLRKAEIIIVLSLLMIALLFTSIACTKRSSVNDSKSTGYPEGEIQNLFIYYDGHYWIKKDSQGKRTESDYIHLNKVGTTLEDHIYKIPPEDFHTARMELGSTVFEDVERKEVIVLQKQNTVTFIRMDPEEESSFIKSMDEDEAKANKK